MVFRTSRSQIGGIVPEAQVSRFSWVTGTATLLSLRIYPYLVAHKSWESRILTAMAFSISWWPNYMAIAARRCSWGLAMEHFLWFRYPTSVGAGPLRSEISTATANQILWRSE